MNGDYCLSARLIQGPVQESGLAGALARCGRPPQDEKEGGGRVQRHFNLSYVDVLQRGYHR